MSGKTHLDLIKLQVEFGATHSYRDSEKDLKRSLGENRKSINRMSIQRVTKRIGLLLEAEAGSSAPSVDASAKQKKINVADVLHVAVDGGYVHDANNKGHNFEVMVGKIYQSKNVVRTDKHHTSIVKKHCAASAKDDEQSTMIKNMIEAAKKEGIDKKITTVVALADGAKNCWNIIDALTPLCLTMLLILDWFHIGKYVRNIQRSIPIFKERFDDINDALWHGSASVELELLAGLLEIATDTEHIRLINNFYTYIKDNENKIVDYDYRKKSSLIISSHVAESTVEHLLNKRAKKKQKMQWSREGLHAVMKIRSSQVSGEWLSDWNRISEDYFKAAA